MAFCRNCGKEIDDRAAVCIHCGVAQNKVEGEDKGGFLWGLLGCCVPVAGLILFLMWKETKPKTAKAAGIGALVAAICMAIYYVFVFGLGFFLGLMGM